MCENEKDQLLISVSDGVGIVIGVESEYTGDAAATVTGVACVNVGDGSPCSLSFVSSSPAGIIMRSTFSGAAPKFDWLCVQPRSASSHRQSIPKTASRGLC